MGSDDRYARPPLDAPSGDRFVYAGWSVDPPRLPRVGRSARRGEVVRDLAALAVEQERAPDVVAVEVYETFLIAPVPGAPRLDVLVLGRARDDAAAARLTEAVGARDPRLLMRARNTRRFGDTDGPGTGTFLFNHFTAPDPDAAVDVWERVGGWFVQEVGVDNSTLLQPDAQAPGPQPYPLVNHVQVPCGPGAFLRRQVTRPSFHTYVRRLLSEHGMVAYPLFARRARAAVAAA